MKRILTIILIAASICACDSYTQPDSFEAKAAMYLGEYELTKAHWEGLAIDLNDDGRGSWDLLNEYIYAFGYYEPYHNATVTMGKTSETYFGDAPYISVNVHLPFPAYTYEDGSYRVIGIKYIPMTIRVDNLDYKNRIARIIFKEYDEDTERAGDIYNLVITEMTEHGFNLRLNCSLLHEDANGIQTVNRNYLNYTYTR